MKNQDFSNFVENWNKAQYEKKGETAIFQENGKITLFVDEYFVDEYGENRKGFSMKHVANYEATKKTFKVFTFRNDVEIFLLIREISKAGIFEKIEIV